MCSLECPDHAAIAERALALLDGVLADRVLEVEHQAGPDRLDDRRGAALLAVGGVRDVAVAALADVGHGAAARHGGHPVVEQGPLGHQHARGAGPADELVRRDEDRVLGGEAVAVAFPIRVHVDADVGRGGGEVPEGQCAVPVEQLGDAAGVGDDAGDVGGGR